MIKFYFHGRDVSSCHVSELEHCLKQGQNVTNRNKKIGNGTKLLIYSI